VKKLGFWAVIIAAVVVALLYVNRRHSRRGPVSSSDVSNGLRVVSETPEVISAHGSAATSNPDRFTTEVMPILSDFLSRVESLASIGVRSPLSLPITLDQTEKIRFAGGPSNTLCTFVVGGHSLFVCHLINRGKEIRGVNTFRRTGIDETGMPRNIIQLTDDPTKNEQHIKQLTDPFVYPPRDLQEVAVLAQRALAALLPQDSASYRLNESWREQVGSTALPYYIFAFVRKDAAGTDPSNLMRDEIMIGFKSTKAGLILDSFEDNSIAFIAKKK
jgi:hypothetical protein